MSLHDRAAQFAPFAALTGYDDAVKEAGRLTDSRPEPDENELYELDLKLSEFAARISQQPEVTITYFEPDAVKEGGAFVTFTGRLKKISGPQKRVVFTDGRAINIADIISIT